MIHLKTCLRFTQLAAVQLKVFIPVYVPNCELVVNNNWVYTHGGLPKNKEMVYTPMGGSTIINVMVYVYFWVSPKLKV